MRIWFILLLVNSNICYAQTKLGVVTIGAGYRLYPIDIEDVGYDNVTGRGLPFDDLYFWKSTSIVAQAGLKLKDDWQINLSSYIRYNHMNWLQGHNLSNPSPAKRKEKKNIKTDLFISAEKYIRLEKEKERFFSMGLGIGLTNINSQFDVTLQDTLENGSVTSQKRYKENIIHFGPKIDFSYQRNNIKLTVDIFIIEGPDLNNLTSIWPGLSLSYVFNRKKK